MPPYCPIGEALLEPVTRGDPPSPLRWTCKSAAKLAAELNRARPLVRARTVSRLLKTLNYSLPSNRKTKEGGDHPDRNAQFEHLRAKTKAFHKRGQPAISVEAKKKELVGDFKNNGREWRPKGQPEKVCVHDFADKELGKAIPYGVYDIAKNEGLVNVCISSDTDEFAVNTIRTWWQEMGKEQYSNSKKILITADGGGSNSSRGRLWKTELQKLATEIGLEISVCHFPPGTSKWNKIEHRLFSFISKNWRAKPLTSIEVVVNLIANTTTEKGLKVKAKKDTNLYAKSIKITDTEMEEVKLKKHKFRGEWNYTIVP
jgi:hypothetical protein